MYFDLLLKFSVYSTILWSNIGTLTSKDEYIEALSTFTNKSLIK